MKNSEPGKQMNNFDKEFSMTQKKNRTLRGKLPSWLLIAAGAAAMGGVVIAKQPAVTHTETITRSAVSAPTAQIIAADPAVVAAINDQKADSAELAAHFSSQDSLTAGTPILFTPDEQPFSMQLEPLQTDSSGQILPPESDQNDTVIYWVEDKPYALTVETLEGIRDAASGGNGTTVYTLGGRDYKVSIEPMDNTDLSALSSEELSDIVNISGKAYRLTLSPAAAETAKAASGSTNSAAAGQASADKTGNSAASPSQSEKSADTAKKVPMFSTDIPAVARLADKTYLVTVDPYDGKTENDPVSANPAPDRSAVISVEGNSYEIRLDEADPEEYPAETASDSPVVWLDETPMHVTLRAADTPANNEAAIDILLEPVTVDELPQLMQQFFGEDYHPEEEQPTPTPTVPAPTEEPQESGNWFTNIFNGIFGSSPTEVPTPQITVIPMEPTAPAVQPTATPLVVRIQSAAAPQEPVRLDAEETKTAENPKEIDPALIDEDADEETPVPTRTPVRVQPTVQSPVRTVVAVVIDEETAEPEISTGGPSETSGIDITEIDLPAPSPTPSELPHTGGAESWNIPSMLIMLAGLLLVIIGVRRLRTHQE